MVSLKNVTKKYGDHIAVNSINLEIQSGQFVVLVGPSGCGKTTTLKMINRLIEPTSGEIFFEEKNIDAINPVQLRRNIGYVIQGIGLFPNMTILENVEIVPKLLKWPKEKTRKKAYELMETVGMDPDVYANKFPSELSGGEQQRIGVLRAVAAEPSLILMDEPFGALDPITRDNLQEEVKKLHKTIQTTFVFVTHDMSEAIKIADIIVFMNHGSIVQVATPEEILRSPANDFVRNFIGNHIAARVENVTVKDVMSKNIKTVSAQDAIETVRFVFQDGQSKYLVAVDKCGNAEGVITPDRLPLGSTDEIASDLMDRNIASVCVKDSRQTAFRTLKQTGADFLAVLDERGQIAGLVSNTELLDSAAQDLWGRCEN